VPAAVDHEDERRLLDGRRVLIVDDDEDICEMLAAFMAENGATVEVALGGVQGLEVLAASGGSFDAIVLDLMMPVVTGWDVWDWLQTTPAGRRIPVVIYTASGLQQGAVAHARVLNKVSTTDEIVAAVREAIETWPHR
jgi:CheY-like chemotaxis protein